MKKVCLYVEYLAIEQGKMVNIMEIPIVIFICSDYFLLSHFGYTTHFKTHIVGRPDVG